MSKEMIISVNGREKKIAIIENGRVSEFYIERGDEENSGIVGNIYKGRVMRVLPGMQSAFVGIGLERDAFLYVSDFFDEEEEIERIVMEKSKKSSPEEAAREATDQIQRARLEREKQMEAVQAIAEPMVIGEGAEISTRDETAEEVKETGDRFAPRENRGKLRGGKRERQIQKDESPIAFADFEESSPAVEEFPRDSKEYLVEESNEKFIEPTIEPAEEEIKPVFEAATLFEMEDSGFERIIDDEDTGDMFKDAYRQEAIVDKVRAIEFDMESSATAEVGSLLGSVTSDSNGFERIADDDDEPAADSQKSKTGRGTRGGRNRNKSAKQTGEVKTANQSETVEAGGEETETKSKGSAKSNKSTVETSVDTDVETASRTKPTPNKKKNRGGKKTTAKETLEDAEASVKESDSNAEMAVRRGGRGRRRPNERSDQNTGAETSEPMSPREPMLPRIEIAEENFQAETAKPNNFRSENNRENNRNESPRNDNPRSNSRNDNQRRGGNGGNNRRERNQPTITDLLREGQEILVQIAKEPIAKKGARITSHIALPGRFLVYMPTIEHLGVSRKIESASERSRLRIAIQKIKSEEDVPSGGFIVRTAGVGIPEQDLRQDARYLVRTWLDMKKIAEKAKSPALVHQDLDIIQRLLRDQLSDEFTAIRVDSEEEYLRIVEFINRIQPRMMKRVKLYTRDEPILEAYGVQEEVDKALKPRVWLKSGGYLVINQTEALVAIDVNTGKFVGKGNARLEDTITKTNMEAVDEIARQIRLRDLGGIIVLDLIDM
ncbi:MAG: Rne/Rng family ribonuclease, partial [Acidobacteriota bacterium]|nr:Rne/Rng family ribonuclease [Acidobacteriota bacterium]